MRLLIFRIALGFVGIVILVACGQVTPQLPTNTTLLSPTTQTTVKPTLTWTPVPSLVSPTPIPLPNYQLTFIADGQNIYGMDVGCLESDSICFGEEELMFSVRGRHGEPAILASDLSWSPNGSRVALCANGVGGQYDIFWADLEDLNWTNITNSEFYECVPNWTPDGLRLVYEGKTHELYGSIRIFSVLPNGQEPIQLLSIGTLGDEGQIALSPDGNRLAFNHRDDNGFYQLFIADLDGSNRVQLTDLPAHNFGPSFSPDGKWLVFHRQTDPYSVTNQYDDSRNHIVIMNIETREDSTIISGNNGNENFASPTWAPFGQWIAFTSNVGGSYDIYIIRADGSGLTRVTSSPGNESHPKWRVYYSP